MRAAYYTRCRQTKTVERDLEDDEELCAASYPNDPVALADCLRVAALNADTSMAIIEGNYSDDSDDAGAIYATCMTCVPN